ncbi:hypothetical protein [Candidatus Poriferisodalis sp.]
MNQIIRSQARTEKWLGSGDQEEIEPGLTLHAGGNHQRHAER